MKNINIFPEGSDITKLNRVKFGIDPTFPKLHLGHLVPLRIVKDMQDQGKDITIVLGTFTAQMGDPSGKDATRPILSKDDVEDNAIHILNQIKSILKPGFSVFKNGDLFNIMTVPTLLETVSKFTVQNLLSRDAFQKRMENEQSIGLHELIVPILQGTDSVHLKSEIEIGGSDQLFNFQIARRLQELDGQTPEICMMMPIINGTDGRKMSKSLGNCIFLDESADDIFGKCMSISDVVMLEWIPLLTDLEEMDMSNPMMCKKIMSHDIVEQIKGIESADEALDNFINTIQSGKVPDDIKEIVKSDLISFITKVRNCSNSEARRLLNAGSVKVNDEKIDEDFELGVGQIVKIGKRNFAKVI